MTADGPGHSGHRAAPSLPAARLDALTDGIFAVAMTLLVLGLDRHIPDPLAGQTLFGGLLEFGDQFADYVISFAVLGVFWLGHLRMTRRLREADTTFVLGNLAFLFFVTMIPPLTTLIGDHPNRPRAAILYGANLLFLLLCEAAMWHRICHRLANESLANPLGTWRLVRKRYGAALAVVIAGIVAAMIEIRIGVTGWHSRWIYVLLIGLGVVRPPVRGVPRA
ncbi:MAG TPA: TMEM175 family protein [Casimicrobiaceae bacterium]|nr:TMEM175 family protein [Casimicrobiaceae bacterium]